MRVRHFFSILFLPLLVGGCASTASTSSAERQGSPARDDAMSILAWASEEVHEELMAASFIMRGKGPQSVVLSPSYELMRFYEIDFNWTGPAWPALVSIAGQLGYNPRLVGKPPLNDPVVTLAVKESAGTVYDLLSDIYWQIQPYGGSIKVDSVNKILALVYKSSDELK